MTATRIPVLGLLFFTAALTAAQAPPSQTRRQTYTGDQDAVVAAFKKNDAAGYRDALVRLHADFPMKSRPLRQLGLVQLELKNDASALEWLNQYADRGLLVDLSQPPLAEATSTDTFSGVKQKFQQNAKPVSSATPAFKLPAPDLIAEDIAYDAATKRFFISSVHERKILVCEGSGACKDFVKSADVKPALWAMMALRVDPLRKLLWATTASMNMEADHVAAEDGSSAVLKFDLASGKLLKRYEIGDKAKRAFGDMTVSSHGDVYVADGLTGDVFVIRRDRDELERLVPEGTFVSPQTPALSADEQTLFVPDYTSGIARVDLKSKTVSWIEGDVPAATDGIDGLYWRDGWLIGVQNGVEPERVAAFHLNQQNRVDRVKVLEANTPGLGDPTHGVIVGSDFYFIANSGWDRVQDDGTIKAGQAAEVRKSTLPGGQP